nr:unnamed protein product [Callosobruchus chinensis]
MGSQSSYNFYLTKSLSNQFVDKDFKTMNKKSITFSQISCVADVWMYIENHFIPSIFWEYTYDNENMKDENAMNVIYDNRVLGVPRLRQVRVRNDSCKVHNYFRSNFTSCYGTYKPSHTDKADFGPGGSTAWMYSSTKETKSMSYRGRMSTYEGDGFYVDLLRERNGTLKIIKHLQENKWIRRGTRAVFIEVTIYNTNTDLYAVCKFIFEFPPVGGVISNADIYSMKLLRFSKKWDIFVWICELASYVFVSYYLLEEVREIIYFKWRYLLKFWNCIDLAIVASALAAGAWSVMEFIQVPLTMEELRENPDQYANVDHLASMFTSKNHLYAMLLFFVFMKVFKYLNFNRVMGQLSNTLKQNMFLAIISDTYTNVRTEIATGPDEMQMSEYLRDKFYRLLRKVGIKTHFVAEAVKDENSAAVERITELLKK